MYVPILYFPFEDLYNLAYISLRLVHVIYFLIYTRTQVFFHGIRAGFLIFLFISLSLLSRSRHYSHRITHFFGEYHCLLFISYLRKPKTEVIGHSEVDLVETIKSVCNR